MKKKSSPDKHSESPTKHKDENTDKRHPNSVDPNEATEPPIKEMSTTGGPDHPHNEEILDDIPN